MHRKTVTWFTWGFWTMVVPFCFLPVPFIIFTFHEVCAQLLLLFQCCACGISAMAWLITGCVWRYNLRGTITYDLDDRRPEGISQSEWYDMEVELIEEGGYQVYSGSFMNAISLTFLILTGFICLCNSFLCFIIAYNKS